LNGITKSTTIKRPTRPRGSETESGKSKERKDGGGSERAVRMAQARGDVRYTRIGICSTVEDKKKSAEKILRVIENSSFSLFRTRKLTTARTRGVTKRITDRE
jgi:hypothetical protein